MKTAELKSTANFTRLTTNILLSKGSFNAPFFYAELCPKFDGKKTGIFAAGVAFGTAGIKILTSKDAKKLYTNCTAAVLRAKACVMKTASAIQENAEDIYAEAQQINEDRAAAEEVVEDTAEEVTDFREETEETTEEGSEE